MKPTLPEPDFHQATIHGYSHGYSAEVAQSLIDEAYKAGLADAREWLPIESAPKNGTAFLAFAAIVGGRVRVAYFLNRSIRDQKTHQILKSLTRWQPLPPAPEKP